MFATPEQNVFFMSLRRLRGSSEPPRGLSSHHVSTASQAAADARGRAGHQSAAASNLSGLSLQEAQQILNISKLTPEEVQKVRPLSVLGWRSTGRQKRASVKVLTTAMGA